jgi:type VI secretion system secreted protein Hcp
MADAFYVSIVGRKQGKFHGEGSRQGKIEGLAFHYEVTSPRDAASGQASGKRQHSPVTFVKQWGASSPQLLEAAVSNEVLNTVLFEFIETNPNGEEVVFHTLKLTNASVASIKQDVKAVAGGKDLQDLEEVSFVFQSIEMENQDGKTMAADDWRSGGGSRLADSSAASEAIAVQEPFAGVTGETRATTDKISAPRLLLSRVPSTGG